MLAGAGGASTTWPCRCEAVAAVRRVGEGEVLSDAELARIAAALVDVRCVTRCSPWPTATRRRRPSVVVAAGAGAASAVPRRSLSSAGAAASCVARDLWWVWPGGGAGREPDASDGGPARQALQNGIRLEEIRGLIAGLPPAVSA